MDGRAATVNLVHFQKVEYHRDEHLVLHAEELRDAVRDPRFHHVELDQSQIHPAVELGGYLAVLDFFLTPTAETARLKGCLTILLLDDIATKASRASECGPELPILQ